MPTRQLFPAIVALLPLLTLPLSVLSAPFESSWSSASARTWTGPEYWANRLQDWQVREGRLECVTSGGNRNVNLLTRELADRPGDLTIRVRLGALGDAAQLSRGWAGIKIGTKGRLHDIPELADYRDNAMRGRGLDAGVTTDGHLFIGRPTSPPPRVGIDRTSWKVHRVSSQHNDGDMAAQNAFDGDPQTIWHSKFGQGGAKYPHEFVLDLGRSLDIHGIAYVGRQSPTIGRIKGYQLFVSETSEAWEAAAEGAFEDTEALQEVRFKPRRGRYLKLVATSGIMPRPAAVIAELFVFDAGADKKSDDGKSAFSGLLKPHMADLALALAAQPNGERYDLTLQAINSSTGAVLAQTKGSASAQQLTGGFALVCNAGLPPSQGKRGRRGGNSRPGGKVRFWFSNWHIGGSKVDEHDDRTFGPILWSQYTLSHGVLKVTAQMAPIGELDQQHVRLEAKLDDGYREVTRATIDPDARTATCRVVDWDASRDTPYRLVYALKQSDGTLQDHVWTGTIRRDPVDKETLVVAAFTGNSDPAFPNNDIVKNVTIHDPDLLFFSGDQIYENVGGYGTERKPVDRACLDYLRKWYIYGWAFRELMRDRPCVSIPDDHDVYQGNIWGAGGRSTTRDNLGGYVMPARWVRMVERTQTSHLPDPFDPTPVEQNIGVYYCHLLYGRISFAVLEDRKFKSGCAGLVPPTTAGRPDHVIDPDFDPKTADVEGAQLLGDRQLQFLREWAADWRGADMKTALSQTVFANAATHHGGGNRYLVADYDSNGWPQAGRRRALHEIRRAFGFMVGGDQHLATIIHHGVETWNDAGWSFLVPSVTNFYLRSWLPKKPANRSLPGLPAYTGEHLDGFGNHVTVWAATNPERDFGPEPKWLHSKKPGYGIVRFNRPKRTITMECWPRYVDPRDPASGSQYGGWPKTISQLENYGRKPASYLPTVRVRGVANPIIQVVREEGNEVLYTVRVSGLKFSPHVFGPGTYTVRVAPEHIAEKAKEVTGLSPTQNRGQGKTIDVTF
ncbi:MAG: hypothetical protein HN742_02570 [Lentisphaerae bacterium]|jgi:alkaline phosphatase D|nr:hypothetical protein [Lentisphaerota bacterium]MBT4819676.1 hypothetical protein [Lentisphaerota bacterium]MBT5608040.1 hypothetical protein [Lentisphaerota bacterium]MBT7056492.1 hypothetical protein [Lentisphaerota bacterium]MBT7840723.1 hypothetical protein [Lentisphaerota bacterium]